MMQRIFLVLALVLLSCATSEAAETLYIAAKRLHIGDGTSIENGAVIVVDGRIVYAGPAAAATLERRIGGLIDLAHAAFADEGGHVVMAESGADVQGHSLLKPRDRFDSLVIP